MRNTSAFRGLKTYRDRERVANDARCCLTLKTITTNWLYPGRGFEGRMIDGVDYAAGIWVRYLSINFMWCQASRQASNKMVGIFSIYFCLIA